jgi:hypothetical protein
MKAEVDQRLVDILEEIMILLGNDRNNDIERLWNMIYEYRKGER